MVRRATSMPRQQGITLVELLVGMLILGIVSTMLITGWVNLQRSSAFAVESNDTRGDARDALARVANELRDAQPVSLPTGSPTPSYVPDLLTEAQPMSATFYSVFNEPGAGADVGGSGARRLTRIWLDTTDRTLYWRRDTNESGTIDPGDRTMVLAHNVMNGEIPDATVVPNTPYTALFRYAYRDTGGSTVWTDNAPGSLDLATIMATRARVILDANLSRPPEPVDATTTILPRNAIPY
jgi:prepilin-type N-terminal cleavage/methylation domain-containing protein